MVISGNIQMSMFQSSWITLELPIFYLANVADLSYAQHKEDAQHWYYSPCPFLKTCTIPFVFSFEDSALLPGNTTLDK